MWLLMIFFKLFTPIKWVISFLMNPKTIAFVVSHWKLVLVGVLIALLGWQNYSHGNQIKKKDKTINEQVETILTNEMSINNLNSAIENQNSAIQIWKETGVILEGHVKAAGARSAAMEGEVQRLLGELAKKPVPKDCKGSMNWMRTRATEDLKW